MECVATASAPAAASSSTITDNNVNGKRPRDGVDSRPQQHRGRQNRFKNNNQHNTNQKRRHKGNGRQPPKPAPPPVPVCSVCSIEGEKNGAQETALLSKETTPPTSTTPKEPPKYKCPKCRALYCSVACCRKHKLICPGKPPEAVEAATGTDPIQSHDDNAHNDAAENYTSCESDDESLEEGWKITDEMKEALQKSSWLRKELQDGGGLRDMIAQVVRSSRAAKSPKRNSHRHRHNHRRPAASFTNTTSHNPAHDALLEQRNDNPNFNMFCDKLLVLAGVLERQNGGATQAATSASTSESSSTQPNNAPRDSQELEQWLKQKWEPDQPPPSLALKPIRKKSIPKFDPVDVSSSSESEEDEEDDDSNGSNGSGTTSEESSKEET